MASNKELSSEAGKSAKTPSPQSSPQRASPAAQNTPSPSTKKVAEPESYVAAAKQQAREKLPQDVKSLKQKYADLFKKNLQIEEQQVQTVIPYYADVSTNKYSVLRTAEKPLDDEDPYNMAIADFISQADQGDIFRFEDPKVKKEAKPLLEDLAIYIHKLSHCNFDYAVENGTSTRSQLFKKVNNYVADLYWSKVTGLTDPLVPTKILELFNKERKKRQIKSEELYNHRSLLYATLKEFNSGEHADRMANAYCHMIRTSVHRGMARDEEYYEKQFIAKHKRFTPSLQMMHVKGYVPDVKVSKYKNLFISSEWDSISDSVYAEAEKQLSDLFRKQVTYNNFNSTVRKVLEMKEALAKHAGASEIRNVRRERLLVASRLKASHKGKTPFNLNLAVAQQLSDPRVEAAFNPFRIPFAEGDIETSPGECLTCLEQGDDGLFRYRAESGMDKKDDGAVKRIALNFIAFLNG
jgi:hypothetical protein